MPHLIAPRRFDAGARPGTLRAGIVATGCLLRNLPLLCSSAPRTPLRVLCVVAFDTLHALRYTQPLSRRRRKDLAAFLDFQAGTNALWDRKPVRSADYLALMDQLHRAGLGMWVKQYRDRLSQLEARRPLPGGEGRRHFDDVRVYREGVVRLSLAVVAAIALNIRCLDDAIEATGSDSDIAALFGIAMHCQIVDDVVDYRSDISANLPSFLTACVPRSQALEWTAEAARFYAGAGRRGAASTRALFPFEVSLRAIAVMTRFVLAVAR